MRLLGFGWICGTYVDMPRVGSLRVSTSSVGEDEELLAARQKAEEDERRREKLTYFAFATSDWTFFADLCVRV